MVYKSEKLKNQSTTKLDELKRRKVSSIPNQQKQYKKAAIFFAMVLVLGLIMRLLTLWVNLL